MIESTAFLTAVLAAASVGLAGVALIMTLRGLTARTIEHRVIAVSRGRTRASELSAGANPLGPAQRLLFAIGEMVRGRTRLYSERDIAALEGLIASSGFRPRNVLPVLLGIKVVLLIGAPAAALLYTRAVALPVEKQVLVTVCALPFGMLGPDWVIKYLRKPYLAALRRGVPDALDLLVVCSEAGMGLETALEHVSTEMRHSNPPIAFALGRLLDDMRILPDRRAAFRNFATRTGVDGARRVSTMMAQSMQYGTPLSQALRTVAIDLRRERMVTLEAKAGRLPVLLTLPLILFIMPCLFIVLLGPTLIGLQDSLTHILGH